MTSNTLTSVRTGVAATRLADVYRSKKNDENMKSPSAVICIDTGLSTTIGGYGHLLDKVKNNQPLCGFTGAATEPVKTSEYMFSDAPYKEVSFKDTLVLQKYDVASSEYYYNYVCTV